MNIKKIAAAMVSAAVVCGSAAALAAQYEDLEPIITNDGYTYTSEYSITEVWQYRDLNVAVPEDTKVKITAKLQCIEGAESGENKGTYFQYKTYDNDNKLSGAIDGNQGHIYNKNDSSETDLGELCYSVNPRFQLRIINVNALVSNVTVKAVVEMTPTAYKVTAGEGVTLNGVEDDGYVTAGSTVSYTYNEKEYTSEAITAPTVIEAPTEDETVIDAAALNGGEAYEDGSMGWTVTAGDPETAMTSAKWLITNDEGVTVEKEAAMTTFTGKAVFGLVLTDNAIGDNTISSVQFDFE